MTAYENALNSFKAYKKAYRKFNAAGNAWENEPESTELENAFDMAGDAMDEAKRNAISDIIAVNPDVFDSIIAERFLSYSNKAFTCELSKRSA